ncbi:hypothetical protein NTHI1209_02123 [Haemophilus influenzae]|uniref:Uncharacterized protein n=1 Tax=Haemophilus influenzae TaxID=727 RepID=A0A158T024_HAEIF|nr:hypothetical protein NTHI1209_02123 [Haemophilus influenzae]
MLQFKDMKIFGIIVLYQYCGQPIITYQGNKENLQK